MYDLRSETDDQNLVDEVANDWKESSLTEQQKAICYFAEKLTLYPGKIELKDISEIVQIVSYFNYINRVADGLGLAPESFINKLGYKKNLEQ